MYSSSSSAFTITGFFLLLFFVVHITIVRGGSNSFYHNFSFRNYLQQSLTFFLKTNFFPKNILHTALETANNHRSHIFHYHHKLHNNIPSNYLIIPLKFIRSKKNTSAQNLKLDDIPQMFHKTQLML